MSSPIALCRVSTVRAPALRKKMLQLGEHLLDRIHVWAVGRQIEEGSSTTFDRLFDAGYFMATEIIEDNNITSVELGSQHLLRPGPEAGTIDRSIEHARCVDPIVTERCEESCRLPMSVRCHAVDPFSLRRATVERRHVGRGPGLVDKDQLFGSQFSLLGVPFAASLGNVFS
jgi:hypothetical protein